VKQEFEAIMLRVHFGEDDRWKGQPLQEMILKKCEELNIAVAMVYRGIEGFGASARIRRKSMWSLSKDAPIMLSILDTEEQIGKLIPHLDAMVEEGLLAMSRVHAIRYSTETKSS
jgi:hypothetical protein